VNIREILVLKLTTLNDITYAPAVSAFIRECALLAGFEDDRDMESIESAVLEAFENAVKHGYPDGAQGLVTIETGEDILGLEIIVRDYGAPFDMEGALVCDFDIDGVDRVRGLCRMGDLVDEVSLISLGSGGKAVRLVKRRAAQKIEDYFPGEQLEAFPQDRESGRRESTDDEGFTIGPLKPEEAVEVSRCVYKSYGYSYALDHVYYPDRIIGLNRKGQMFSVVCRTPDNEVAGHCALVFHEKEPRIAELAQAFVKPEHRSKGCFSKMNRYLIDKAREMGLLGLYGQAVTNHTYSQKMGLSLGMKDSAIKLGYVPQTASFKGITDHLPQRDSLIIQFLFLKNDPEHVIYPPEHHREMTGIIMSETGAGAVLEKPLEEPEYGSVNDDTLGVELIKTLNAAIIDVKNYTERTVEAVQRTLRELCLEEAQIVHLYLDMSDPMTYFKTVEFEDMGFFFSGVLPGQRNTDTLILQYLNNLSLNYDYIKIESETGQELLKYVRNNDPNLK
jgi:serine/threonine-protein kinase RsbW